MPVMDGIEATKKIKEMKETKVISGQLKIIINSAFTERFND